MADDERIRALVEEALDSERTPEDVCSEHPELLHAVRARWARVHRLQSEIDELFPPSAASASSGANASGGASASSGANTSGGAGARGRVSTDGPRPGEPLPQVPGHVVEAVLGRGGVGIVYRAKHQKLNRDVAVKMLLAGEYATPAELERFLLEAESVASLRHPNIVQVHDVGELDGRPYFTLEFVEGGTLAQRLAGTPQPASVAAELVATLADAVQVAHDGGIVHRDLKPSNVLLTADGTPKITDFGLARRLESGASLTASGTALGTPSYMAPEQVQGPQKAIGPTVDVYALGAILYEMLTGRPPFRAESPLATQMQVVNQDPVAPSRLNAMVPRDLETICVKCLNKDPAKRYASAAALAQDLRRFQRGEPIAARRTGAFERGVKWVRRRPEQAAVIAVSTLCVLGLAGAALWVGLQRASTARDVRADLLEVETRVRASEWTEARTALERAKARIGAGGTAVLRELVQRGERDLDFVARLDGIRLQRVAVVEGRFDLRANKVRADGEYEAAFRAAGWGNVGDDPALVAALVSASNIRDVLVAALDDWAICAMHTADEPRQDWLLAVARLADPDPTGWRGRVRDPSTWKDWAALVELARSVPHGDPSLPCLMALAERLADAGGDAIPLLEQVQRRHPSDFWANFTLADTLREERPGEAIRYYQAALAIRPDAAVARNNLGWALGLDGRIDEAIEQFGEALRLDPDFAQAQANLGNALALAGRTAEAIDAYRQAIALDPEAAVIRTNLAKELGEQGRLDEALAEAERAIAIDPNFASAYVNAGFLLKKRGRTDEAIDFYRRGLALDDARPTAHLNLGIALIETGRLEEAIAECRRAVELAPSDANVLAYMCDALRTAGLLGEAIRYGEEAVRLAPALAHARTSLASALTRSDRLDEAIVHFREAARLAPDDPDSYTNLGNVLGLKQEFDLAIEQFEQALRLAPDSGQAHASLGQAHFGRGRMREACDGLRRGLELFPADAPQRAECVQQLQLCERLLALEARMPGVLDGSDGPESGVEAFLFATLCRLQARHAPAARLYELAFDLDPSLAEEPLTTRHYDAARCASFAASDRSGAAVELDPVERRALRQLAREWLEDELASYAELLDRGSVPPAFVRGALSRWRADPFLAGLREPQALEALDDDERHACLDLWNQVGALLASVEAR